MNWTLAANDTRNWTQKIFSSSLKRAYYRLKEELVKDKFTMIEETTSAAALNCLISKRNESAESLCASVIPLLPSSSDIANVIYDDLIFPAFLMVWFLMNFCDLLYCKIILFSD